jgi:hypothetical protein
MDATLPPVWLVALLAAGAAPFVVGAWQSALERRMRQRTLDVIARAGLSAPAGPANPMRSISSTRSRLRDNDRERSS